MRIDVMPCEFAPETDVIYAVISSELTSLKGLSCSIVIPINSTAEGKIAANPSSADWGSLTKGAS